MSLPQQLSKNFQNVKGNPSSLGFAIKELPSEESVKQFFVPFKLIL